MQPPPLLFSLCVLALLQLGGTTRTTRKVQVEIMVESFCPCSGSWQADWAHDLIPRGIGEIAELSRFFDAKKNGTQGCCDPSADAHAGCMHTKSECVADDLQRCVQAHYPNPSKWLAFTNCISGPCGGDRPDVMGCKFQFDIGQAKNLAREQACAANLTMSWPVIDHCWAGTEGVELMRADANKSNAVEPRYGLSGLPVVWIDGKLFSHFFDCRFTGRAGYQRSLVTEICAASSADPLPDVCRLG